MIKLISTVYATAPVPLGTGIVGEGPFQDLLGGKAVVGQQMSDLISNLITTITVVGSLAFVIFFTVAGLKWITAGGDKAKVSEAQTQMTQSAIGLIAMVSSFFIIGIVGAVLGINILAPFATLFP